MKIMIVDDSKFGRGMIHSCLKAVFTDAEYIPAQNGTEALEKFSRYDSIDGGIDLICLDYLMPDLDGITVAEKILKENRMAFIIMVTSNLQTPVKEKALETGIKAFYNKPLHKDSLLDIQQLWNRENH